MFSLILCSDSVDIPSCQQMSTGQTAQPTHFMNVMRMFFTFTFSRVNQALNDKSFERSLEL